MREANRGRVRLLRGGADRRARCTRASTSCPTCSRPRACSSASTRSSRAATATSSPRRSRSARRTSATASTAASRGSQHHEPVRGRVRLAGGPGRVRCRAGVLPTAGRSSPRARGWPRRRSSSRAVRVATRALQRADEPRREADVRRSADPGCGRHDRRDRPALLLLLAARARPTSTRPAAARLRLAL